MAIVRESISFWSGTHHHKLANTQFLKMRTSFQKVFLLFWDLRYEMPSSNSSLQHIWNSLIKARWKAHCQKIILYGCLYLGCTLPSWIQRKHYWVEISGKEVFLLGNTYVQWGGNFRLFFQLLCIGLGQIFSFFWAVCKCSAASAQCLLLHTLPWSVWIGPTAAGSC